MKAVLPITAEQDIAIKNESVKLRYLFFTFLKIGMVSFGGHIALISVVQRVLVDKEKVIDNTQVLNSVSIASLLPGPLAVNVVAQIGYRLRKRQGALVSTIGIILPAFLLMCLLSWTYFTQRRFINSNGILSYVTGVVCAVILATGLQLFKKEIAANITKIIIFCCALTLLLYSGNYLITVGLLIAGGIAGVLLQIQQKEPGQQKTLPSKGNMGTVNKIILLLFAINQVLFFSNTTRLLNTGYLKLVLIFAGISLSLFGGGYVMVPIMESLFVKELHWLSSKEFIDAIAFSQATPGPILVSATFIGYKVAGLTGAFLATVSIFTPAVFLNVIASNIIDNYKGNQSVTNVLAGVKIVVVALILSAAWRLTADQHINWLFAAITGVSFLLNYKYKVSPVYLILGAILTGSLINLL